MAVEDVVPRTRFDGSTTAVPGVGDLSLLQTLGLFSISQRAQ